MIHKSPAAYMVEAEAMRMISIEIILLVVLIHPIVTSLSKEMFTEIPK